MVKKLIALMLVLVLCLSVCACGETEDAKNDSKETTAETTAPTTNPTDPTAPSDPADPNAPANPNDSANPGNSEIPTDFATPEEAASSFLTAFHRNDAETLMKQTTSFENDGILRYFEIDVSAGADKNALLLTAWESLVWGEYAPDRQITVTTTVNTGEDAEETIAAAESYFLSEGFATEADLAKVAQMVVVTCVGVPESAHASTLTAEVFCMKIGDCWYTSYLGTSIRPGT